MSKKKPLNESELTALPEIRRLLTEEFETKSNICKGLGLTPSHLNRLIEEAFPEGYECPKEVVLSRFAPLTKATEIITGKSIAKNFWKKHPSFDFWRRFNMPEGIVSIFQLSHEFNSGRVQEKWDEFHAKAEDFTVKVELSPVKLGNDVPHRKTLKNKFQKFDSEEGED